MYEQKNSIILVADDEDRFRSALVDVLQFFGHKVMEAKTGQELEKKALSILESYRHFALIVDNQMPEKEWEKEEIQWCGFYHVVNLCKNKPAHNLGKHVLFLSRWGLEDLPDQLKRDAEQYGLLQKDQWWNVYTPYTILRGHIERILKLRD